MLPKPVLEEYEGIRVVRDDLLPGGTKQRALMGALLGSYKGQRLVYAGPAQGYAQVALAHACADLGREAVLFVAKRKELHPRTEKARLAGAKICSVTPGYLSQTRALARQYCAETGSLLLPFGLDSDEFRGPITEAARSLNVNPPEVWTVAGTGTLTRALQAAWPRATFFAVQVGKNPDVGRAKLLLAPEAYEQDAKRPPPFPSCSNYDAKAWQFIRHGACKGALFWNVAR